MSPKCLIGPLAAMLFVGGGVAAQDRFDPATLDRLHRPMLAGSWRVLGAQSCASASCHGGPRPAVVQPRVSRGNAYPLWLENDPHAQSWRTFCSDDSVAIMRRLNILDRNGTVIDRAGYDNCLACHNSTRRFSFSADQGATDRLSEFRREGVGCSGCHGPAESWIGTHFRDGWNAEVAGADGFVNAADLLTRSRTCASCHVGDSDRDVNHDIIAAGHPALRYEFATFHARQPKHWRDEESAAAWRYEAQLWLAGQVAALDASMTLLQKRGTAGDGVHDNGVGRWPELSAYDCASCHHSLGFDSRRRPLSSSAVAASVASPDRKPATAIASMWNDIGIRWILGWRIRSGVAVTYDHELVARIDQMRRVLESKPIPRGAEIAITATGVRRALSQWVDHVYATERIEFDAEDLASLVTFATGETESYRTWESAAQLYLAAVAARNRWPAGPRGPAFLTATRLRNGLRYANQTDGPRYAERPETDSRESTPLTRTQVAELTVELAAWMGGSRRPELSSFDDETGQSPRLRERLDAIIDRVNDGLRKQRDQQIRVQRDRDDEPDPDDASQSQPDTARPPDPEASPEPRIKTPQELLEELRNRRRQDGNPFDD